MSDRPLSWRRLVGLLAFGSILLTLASPDSSLAQGVCVPGVPGIGCPAPQQSPPPPDDGVTTGGATGASAPAVAQRAFVGMVSEDTFGGDAAYRSASFPLHRELGIGTLRQPFIWADIEQAKGSYSFGYIDGFVAGAARHGATVLPVLFGTPASRSSKPSSGALRGAYPPRKLSDIAGFARAAAKRYGPKGSFWRKNPNVPKRAIRSWQVWNEPNLPVYWRPSPNAAQYVELLAAASEGVKSVDRGAEIVTAGMPESPNGVPLQEYIAAMYRAGAKRAFETLAINPYGATSAEVIEHVRATRRTMNRFGDRRAKIWVTEFGWADEGPSSRFTVGRAGQAARIRATVSDLWNQRKRLGVRGFVYFNWRDSTPYPGGRDFWGLHTGLMDIDGRPKPAYEAFRSTVAGLR